MNLGDTCELGSQLRPNIVWFGEAVPMIEVAADIAAGADVFLIVGTSMVVYPAAGLIDYVPDRVLKYVVDPKKPAILHVPNLEFIEDKASTGMEKVRKMLVA